MSAAAIASRIVSSSTRTWMGSHRVPAAAMPGSGTQCLFHLGPESLLARHGGHRLESRELLHDHFLLVRQRLRRPHLHAYLHVTRAARVHTGQPASANMEYLSALRAGGHTQCERPRHERDIDVRAEHQLWIRDEHLGEEIRTVALEARVLLDVEHHEDVAARSAARTHAPHPPQRHVLSRRYAGRDLHRNGVLAANASFAATL